MRKASLLILILGFVSIFGANVIIDPWLLKAGDISFSLGFPTLGMRYGLLDLVEIGASIRELGGYIKIGYSGENFAVNAGYSSFGLGIANVFGAVGFRTGGFELALNGRYSQFPSGTGVGESYSVFGETSFTISKSGNMTSFLGAFGYYNIKEMSGEKGGGGVYARGIFEKVWIFNKVNLMGGLALRVDDTFNLFEDVYIIFDFSLFLNIFRR